MIHEPCSLLCYTDGAVNLVGTNAIFAVHDLPHCREPFVQTERAILKNGSRFHCELSVGVTCATLPSVVFLQECYSLIPAARALDPVGPAACHNVITAVDGIREVDDCFLESFKSRFHALNNARTSVICQVN